jgi:NAD-dependent deacetylase
LISITEFFIPPSLGEQIRSAERVAVLTGAGISAESGLPTFRDSLTGLWAQYRAEDLATPEAFRRDPKLVWEWYAWRRAAALVALPNPGHLAIAEMERRVPCLRLITQNVDRLHQRAGSTHVIELHRSLENARCSREGTVVPWPESEEKLPRCLQCGAFLRPDIVWFGEMLASNVLEAAVEAAKGCEVFLVVGTSGVVQPAAGLAQIAEESGATVVVVNPDAPANLRPSWIFIPGPAGEVLPALID